MVSLKKNIFFQGLISETLPRISSESSSNIHAKNLPEIGFYISDSEISNIKKQYFINYSRKLFRNSFTDSSEFFHGFFQKSLRYPITDYKKKYLGCIQKYCLGIVLVISLTLSQKVLSGLLKKILQGILKKLFKRFSLKFLKR